MQQLLPTKMRNIILHPSIHRPIQDNMEMRSAILLKQLDIGGRPVKIEVLDSHKTVLILKTLVSILLDFLRQVSKLPPMHPLHI